MSNIHLTFTTSSNMREVQAHQEQITRGFQNINKEVHKLNQNMAKSGQYDIKGWRELSASTTTIRNDYKSLAEQSGAWTTATRELSSATSDFNNKLLRQKVGLKDVWGQGDKIRAAMREQISLNNMMVQGFTKDATGKISADIFVPKSGDIKAFTDLRIQAGYYNEILGSVSQQTLNWGKNTQWAGRQLTVGFSVPLSMAGGALTKFALDADEGLTRIVKVYGDAESMWGTTTESIRQMASDTALHIAKEFGIAASATRDVMAELAATGMEGPDLQGMTYQVQRLSMLGEMSPDQALKMMRTLREVYGHNTEEMEKQANYFNAIENSTALTMQDIAEGLPRIAGIMKSTGTSIEEQTQLLVAFKSAGIDVAEGANALKSINFKAIAPSPTAAKRFFQITGEDLTEIVEKANGEFIPTLVEIGRAMEGLSQTEKVNIIKDVFGIHQGSRAITLIEQLTNSSVGMQRAIEVGMQSAGEHAASARQEIEALQESASLRFQRMIESARAVAERLGEPIAEMLIPLGQGVTRLLEWIDSLGDRQKKIAILVGAFLTALGPFVMLIGLFGNMIGQIGLAIAMFGRLATRFQLFNADSKAASLLQKAFKSDTDLVTDSLASQQQAMESLTRAIKDYNRSLEDAQRVAAGGLPSTPVSRSSISESDDWAKARQSPRYWEHHSAFSEQDVEEVYRIRAAKRATEEAAETTRIMGEEWNRVTTAVDRSGRAVAGASTAMLALGAVTGNETLSKVSMVGVAIGGLTPLLTRMSDSFGNAMIRMVSSTDSLTSSFGQLISKGVNGLSTALSGAVNFLKGPWGIALGAAFAAASYFVYKHIQEIKELRETYTDLIDTTDDWGEALGFMPSTALQRQIEDDPNFDPNTWSAAQERIKKMREDGVELIDDLVRYSDLLVETHGKDVDSMGRSIVERERLNEAIAQGAQVLRASGDAQKAEQAAYQAYIAMTGETINPDEFMSRIGVTFKSAEDIAKVSIERVKTTISEGLEDAYGQSVHTGGVVYERYVGFSKEFSSQLEKDITEAFNSAMAIEDVSARYRAVSDIMTEPVDQVMEMYKRGLEEGWVAQTRSFEEFATTLETRWKNINRNIRFGFDAEQTMGISRAEAYALQETINILEKLNPNMWDLIENEKDLAGAISGRTSAILELIDAQKRSMLIDERALAVARGDDARIKLLDAELDLLWEKAEAEYAIAEAQAAQDKTGGVMSIGPSGFGMPVPKDMHSISEDAEKTQQSMRDMLNPLRDAKDGVEDLADATGKLSEEQQKAYDTYRRSMEYASSRLVDEYRDQFEASQQAERDAFDAQAQASIQAIDDKYKALEKQADENAKQRQDALAAQHEREKEALAAQRERAKEALATEHEAQKEDLAARRERAKDNLSARHENEKEMLSKQQEAAREALDQANKAARKALDLRREANREAQKRERKELQERFRNLNKQLDKDQKARRDSIAERWDMEIQKIEDQIKKEEELEKIRQRIFEAEKERISRLRELFSDNIDINMAVNEGNFDEAARIANAMQAKRDEWSQDDLSQILTDGSETRKEKLRGQIDTLKERKDAELEAIREVEEAEKEAMRRRQEREEEALEKKYERLDAALNKEREQLDAANEAARKAMDEDFKIRNKNLSDRQKAEQKALDDSYKALEKSLSDRHKAEQKALDDSYKELEKNLNKKHNAEKAALDRSVQQAKEALQQQRDDERKSQEEANKIARAGLDKRLKDAKRNFDEMADFWESMVWKNQGEFERGNDEMFKDFKGLNGDIERVSRNTRNQIWEDTQKKHQREVDKLAQDKSWEEAAAQIAASVMEGVFGFSMSPSDFTNYIRTGELPDEGPSAGRHNRGGSARTQRSAHHSGGIVGNPADSSWTGPGYTGRSQEIDATLLKGEGVLNLAAMSKPGVPEMMRRLNKGENPQGMMPTYGMNKNAYGDGIGFPGVFTAFAAAMNKTIKKMTEVGIQVGQAKAANWVEIILTGKNAGLLSAEQLRNASTIISTGFKMGMSERDILIALMTAMQESSLVNVNYGDDIHGVRNPDGSLTSSLGLFQQQKWWGTAQERMDPVRSSELFYEALNKVRNREAMELWQAAQAVQGSAFPRAYARHESLARLLMDNMQFIGFPGMEFDGDVPANFQGGRNGPGMPWQVIWGMIKRAAPEVTRTSDYRPGAITATGYKSYHGMGRAVDIWSSNMMETFRKIRGLLPWSELIYSPAGPAQMLNGRPYNKWSPITRAMHYDHIHAAYKNGGTVLGKGFGDSIAAMLEPGEFVVRRSVADRSRDFLEALNNGEFEFMPGMARPRTFNAQHESFDISRETNYNLSIEFTGPVRDGLDIETAVREAIHSIERTKPKSRSIRH